MARILLLIVLCWILYLALKRFWSQLSSRSKQQQTNIDAEKIVPCHQCGLHIPESESHTIDGLIFCKNPNCQPTQYKDDS